MGMNHSQKRGNTRLDGPRSTPEQSVQERANREFQRWLRGEVDKFEAITTPQGERIVDSYNRADDDA